MNSLIKKQEMRCIKSPFSLLKDKKAEPILGVPYTKLSIGIPKESWTGEKRVAATPAVTAALAKKGFTVNVESGAGILANFRDAGTSKETFQ